MSIKKLKPFITVAGIMLLLASAAMGYFSAQRLSSIIPASGYEDKGVYSFVPVRVLPVQVENTGATGRARRMNPTKTVYVVHYRDTSKKGYQWKFQAATRETGQKIVNQRIAVERRVLSIPADKHSYITIESEETAESYTAKLQQKNIMILAFSGIYILLYAATWGVILMKRPKKEAPAS